MGKCLLIAVLLLAAPGAGAGAAEQRAGELLIGQAWAAPSSASKRSGSIYLTIHNAGAEPDWLLGAHSPAATITELRSHRAGPVAGPARKVLGIALPAGKTVALKPGAELIALIDVNQPYRIGDTVPVTLIFQRAGEITIDVPVLAEAPKP